MHPFHNTQSAPPLLCVAPMFMAELPEESLHNVGPKSVWSCNGVGVQMGRQNLGQLLQGAVEQGLLPLRLDPGFVEVAGVAAGSDHMTRPQRGGGGGGRGFGSHVYLTGDLCQIVGCNAPRETLCIPTEI